MVCAAKGRKGMEGLWIRVSSNRTIMVMCGPTAKLPLFLQGVSESSMAC